MQRLTSRLRSRVRGRLGEERGASAVLFSLLLVPMLGFAAIAVDVGSLYAERARLQVAADAAALAVAQDCSRGNCGDMLATAQGLITANDGEATSSYPVLSTSPLSVTVVGSTPKEHWFAPVIGHDATAVSATATVGWGAPSEGTAVLPLTFSWCSFQIQTGGGLPSDDTEHVVKLTKSAGVAGCTGPSGNAVPGGFGYLVTDSGTCDVTSALGELLSSSTGNTPPSGCDPDDFRDYLGRDVLLPIFDHAGGTGSGAWYRVYGYAAFRLTGFHFGGQYSTGKKVCGPGSNGSDRCVTGYFTRFVEQSDAWNYSPDAPQLGTSILRLIR
jgi:Flp pilus assembly protein TadG